MPLFSPDLVLPRDAAGFGLWLAGHFLEHRQFIGILGSQTTPIIIPDYDILAWSDDPISVRTWLDAHAQIHNALRAPAGISGIDLSVVDLTDDSQFQVWQDDHSAEHALLRQAFGVN